MADLNAIYSALLGRDVDPSGAATYGNMSEADVRAAIQESPEYVKHLVLTHPEYVDRPVAQSSPVMTGEAAAALPEAINQFGQQFGTDAYAIIPGINDYTAKMEAAAAVASRTGQSVEEVFQNISGMTPSAWQGVERTIQSGTPVYQSQGQAPTGEIDGPVMTPQSSYQAMQYSAPAASTSPALTYQSNPFNFEADPSYAFRKQQGEDALQKRQLASGNFFSGGALKEAADYGSGLASTEYGNAFNRYMQQDDRNFRNNNTNYERGWNADMKDYSRWTDDYNRNTAADNTNWNRLTYLDSSGQNAANQTANAGQSAANNVSNLTQSQGDANAAGYINSSNAWTNSLGNAIYGLRKY
jgi:hypothetical protein